MVFSWTAESQTRTETEPVFKAASLKLWELSDYLTASGPIIHDAPALSAFLRKGIPSAVAWQEDYAFLNGTGAGQPQGVLGASATLKPTRQTPGLIQFSDYATMMSKLTPGSLNHAILLCSPTALNNLLQLKDGTTRAVVITIGANGQPQFTIGPNRLFVTDALPALGTPGDFCMIDPRRDLIGDHERENGTLEIAASLHVKFLQNQLVMCVVRRVDGRPAIDQPITLQDGNTVCSPFVALN
jgi:HK97 family phage major capsid protein